MNIRANFYNSVRTSLFSGKLTTQQVTTMEKMLDFWQTHFTDGKDPLTWLAYTFATAYHETAKTFGPIAEFGKGRGKPYFPYYGRGLVQLTWSTNYKKASGLVGIDLYKNPEKALEVDVAVPIIFIGMNNGLFTGKKYSDYLTEKRTDYTNARRIINGTDRATLIAGYARKFEAALRSE